MRLKDMKGIVEQLMQTDYKSFVQSVISIEGQIHDKKYLDEIYRDYFLIPDGNKRITDFMSFQKQETRAEDFSISGFVIHDPKKSQIMKNEKPVDVIAFAIVAENGTIYNCKAFSTYAEALPELKKGDKTLVNGICEINTVKEKDFYNISIRDCRILEKPNVIQETKKGYLIDTPKYVTFQKDGRETKALRFTLMKKMQGENEFINCTIYGKKAALMDQFKTGDLIKVSGRERKNTGNDGRIFHNFTVEKAEQIEEDVKDMKPSIRDQLNQKVEKGEVKTEKEQMIKAELPER